MQDLQKRLAEVTQERNTAREIALKAILNHTRMVAINNMLWDVVDNLLYGKAIELSLPQREEDLEFQQLKMNLLKGSLSGISGRR